MITIDLTNLEIEGEPGPNLYWMGSPDDFLQLTIDLHKLGRENGVVISLKEFDYVDILHGYSIVLCSSEKGKYLCKIQGNEIIIDLYSDLWRIFLSKFFIISFTPSHDYLDFEGFKIEEDANIIVSSEY